MSFRPPSSAIAIAILVSGSLWAQSATPAAAPAPVAYASLDQVNKLMAQLDQATAAIQADTNKIRVEKWKTDSNSKHQIQNNVDSVQRNLKSALPGMVASLKNAPDDASVTFKLYRNLDALYDVFGTVVEAAGAFGSKDDLQTLTNDLDALETTRRALGERMATLTASKETDLANLRAQVKDLRAAVPPPPPTKIVVDDNVPMKKPAKKKPAAKTAKPTANLPASTSPATPPQQ